MLELKAIEIELAYLRKKIEELTAIISEGKVEQHTHIHYETNNYAVEPDNYVDDEDNNNTFLN